MTWKKLQYEVTLYLHFLAHLQRHERASHPSVSLLDHLPWEKFKGYHVHPLSEPLLHGRHQYTRASHGVQRALKLTADILRLLPTPER